MKHNALGFWGFGVLGEFNLLLDSKGKVFVIDFPQIISIKHPNAEL